MTKKIKKILIANRGEIACRVMKTCRQMGIASVAVYSDADRKALHVRTADEAVHIGASPAAESYLVIDKIIAACKSSGADAVHPGYGFLSENPTFARRLQKEGITFIGPSPESMEAMGLKDAAKKLMEKAGVPVTPGYHGKDQDHQLLKAKAGMIGYPVLIKAIAGGGGKGMRKVDAEADFEDALASCQREAKSSFGDDRVLIEKYILSPRHIEVQVFGDTHGNVVHMFERDCSLQRRHQKVIEEAPAPGMTEKVRKAMTDAAIEAAKTVNYVGAGTVEFIVDGSGSLRPDGFWFMEMNTRLQVEHPVTEMITGLDLVELQIRVAQGEKLPKQKEITMQGHAVEARVYAEDPSNDFLPTSGLILCLDYDSARSISENFRVDTGYHAQEKFGIHYDPMIAKVIGYGEGREEAIYSCLEGIIALEIWPLKTNGAFLANILNSAEFKDAKLNTSFIKENFEKIKPVKLESFDQMYGMAALVLHYDSINRASTPFEKEGGWRASLPIHESYFFEKNNAQISVNIIKIDDDFAKISIDNNQYYFSFDAAPTDITLKESMLYYYDWDSKIKPDYVSLHWNGNFIQIPFYDPFQETSHVNASNAITAPMPGKIIAVNASVGDVVKAGDKLIIMEAMKMEMSLEAPRDGVVASVSGTSGTLVADGEVLLTLEEN